MMVVPSKSRYIRWSLCAALGSCLALWGLMGGCPGANHGGNTDPNADPNASGNTDPNNSGSTDPNNGGSTDPNNSSTDPNSTNNGGTTDPNTSNNGGTTVPTPPTALTLSEIARTGSTRVPGQIQSAAVTFTGFSNPVIDAKGRIAFWATYAGTGAVGTHGLFVWDGQLYVAINDDPNTAGIVPGRPALSYFGAKGTDYRPLNNHVVWAAGDRLLFTSDVVDAQTGAHPTRGFYRWRSTDRNLARIADLDQIVKLYDPNGSPNLFAPTFSVPAVSDAGFAVFAVDYTRIVPRASDPNSFDFVPGTGVYTSDGTTVKILADAAPKRPIRGVVPDQASNVFYDSLGALTTISPGGDMLFQGTYAASVATLGGGVYLGRGSTLYRVIDSRSGTTWPGLTAGAAIGTDPYRIAIGPASHIAVATTLTVSGTTHDTVLLWDWSSQTWGELTNTAGTPASALLSGVNDDGQAVVLSDGNPYVVSRTAKTRLNATLPAALQSAAITWADNGGSISNWGRAVLPYTYADGQSGLALWTGAQLLVIADSEAGTPTGLDTISSTSTPERDRPGRSGILNDLDEVVFRGILTDSTQVIYVARGE